MINKHKNAGKSKTKFLLSRAKLHSDRIISLHFKNNFFKRLDPTELRHIVGLDTNPLQANHNPAIFSVPPGTENFNKFRQED